MSAAEDWFKSTFLSPLTKILYPFPAVRVVASVFVIALHPEPEAMLLLYTYIDGFPVNVVSNPFSPAEEPVICVPACQLLLMKFVVVMAGVKKRKARFPCGM
ncbi:hypothetical protein D9M72_596010 [compost metagenome]